MRISILPILLAASGAIVSVAPAQLPTLNEKPWLGHFIGYEDRSFRFGLRADGKGIIQPMKDRKTPVTDRSCPSLEFVVEELVPGRDPVAKRIKTDSLTTSDEATANPEKITFTGKVSGDASFEVVIENDRGDFSVGGRMLDAGKIKNPLRFTIRANFRSIYYKPANDKAFEKKVSKDQLDIVRLDGKKLRFDGLEQVDAKSGEVNGTGLQKVAVDFSPYMGHEFVFEASPNSAIQLWNYEPGPLYKGFSVNWIPDAAKDTANAARLRFTVK